jgi:tetratricopeptide (TPR) repeat protein
MPGVAGTLNNMGNLHANMGHPDEALKYYDEALEIYNQFFLRYPSAYARNFLIALRGAMGVYEKLKMKNKVTECKEMENMIKQLFR